MLRTYEFFLSHLLILIRTKILSLTEQLKQFYEHPIDPSLFFICYTFCFIHSFLEKLQEAAHTFYSKHTFVAPRNMNEEVEKYFETHDTTSWLFQNTCI